MPSHPLYSSLIPKCVLLSATHKYQYTLNFKEEGSSLSQFLDKHLVLCGKSSQEVYHLIVWHQLASNSLYNWLMSIGIWFFTLCAMSTGFQTSAWRCWLASDCLFFMQRRLASKSPLCDVNWIRFSTNLLLVFNYVTVVTLTGIRFFNVPGCINLQRWTSYSP